MYVTAQRVRSAGGSVGINAFLYLHGAGGIPECDIDELVARPPGSRQHQLVTLQPGGNTVDSYLDVIAPDEVDEDSIREFLLRCADRLPEFSKPAQPVRRNEMWSEDDFVARFNWSSRVPGRASDELIRLGTRILAIISDFRRTDSLPEQEPLQVRVSRQDTSLEFTLSPESLARLSDNLDEGWSADRITIDFDTLAAFEQIHGPFWPHAVEALVPLEPEVLERMGGVRVVDAETGQPLWKSFLHR
jgi:hypothetical protein